MIATVRNGLLTALSIAAFVVLFFAYNIGMGMACEKIGSMSAPVRWFLSYFLMCGWGWW